MARVPLADWSMRDSLVWHFITSGDGLEQRDGPGAEAPAPWASALGAVAHDLGCLRYGREIDVDELVWEFTVTEACSVTIGWDSTDDVGGFRIGNGAPADDPFAEAAVWLADTVQAELAGYEFVQWPSEGHHLLVPRLRDGTAVWVDPQNDAAIAAIGELCAADAIGQENAR